MFPPSKFIHTYSVYIHINGGKHIREQEAKTVQNREDDREEAVMKRSLSWNKLLSTLSRVQYMKYAEYSLQKYESDQFGTD